MLGSALRELLRTARVEDSAPGEIVFSSADPVFPTRYRVGTAGAAALAATGVAAADLWSLRTGRPRQRITVDVRATAASLRSSRYLRVDGKPPPEVWDPMSGFYPVAGGRWLSIHCNFAAHRDAALRVLGAPADRAAGEAASRSWDGNELEDAIHAAGGCAGLARTSREWELHSQHAAVAAQPLLEITRIGDAPSEPLPAASRPLSGVRVLDLTRVLAGPTCARTLAEHGADVLKIGAAHIPDMKTTEIDTGIGKLSALLDLRNQDDLGTLRARLSEADVFSQSYRPGTLAARGFSPSDAASIRPGIVYVSLSAWGDTGPWRGRRGFDTIVQTVSGMAFEGGTKPRYLPVSAIDYVSGYLMAFGTMVALARRAREGGSWLVRASLARTGRWIAGFGDLGAEAIAGVPAELPAEEIERLTTEIDAPIGRVRHLKPVLAMSETPPGWTRPPVPAGYHRAEWPSAAEKNREEIA
jgi:crotonobetainyl-CoA:carnitine CoA-transferase CaiB-like acyl-CoA transferase